MNQLLDTTQSSTSSANSSHINIDLNNTESYACIATNTGFMVFNSNPFKCVLTRNIEGGIYRAKMLHKTNIILFVGKLETGAYPNNKLIIWDDIAQEIVSDISYTEPIVTFHATRRYVYVQTSKKLYVYELNTILLLKQFDMTQTPVFAVSESEKDELVIYPSTEPGHVIVNSMDTHQVSDIHAHYGTIENLCISMDGKYLATASEKGTLIRMFSMENRKLLREFRRGIDYVRIHQLLFHPNSRILLAASDRGSIHLFNTEIDETANLNVPANRQYEKYGMNMIKFALPKYFSSKWGFTSWQLPNVMSTSIFHPSEPILYTFGKDGQYYECHYADPMNPVISKTIKYIRDENDPFRSLLQNHSDDKKEELVASPSSNDFGSKN
jgi:WD40 repeat protein